MRSVGTNETVAQIFFNVSDGIALSPFSAPFGSLEIYQALDQFVLEEFFEYVLNDLKHLAVNRIEIKNYPTAYHSTSAHNIKAVLKKLNFQVRVEVTSIISVNNTSFEKRIETSQRQKLKKSSQQFSFTQVGIDELKSCYDFIFDCREEKNQSLSMTFPQLKRTVDRLSDDFLLFKLSNDQETAACGIVVRVSEKVLYTFYYAHNPKFSKVSPIVQLISGIYQYAQHHHFDLIDLGTSMIGSNINESLLKFKASIAGQPSDKYVFSKTIE